jgi:hypothetical protein
MFLARSESLSAPGSRPTPKAPGYARSWTKLINALHAAKLKQTPVSGIGDQASSVLSQTGVGYPAVVVRQGAIGFEVSLHGPKILALSDHGLAKEEALATPILSRL